MIRFSNLLKNQKPINFKLYRGWLKKVIELEKYIPGDISYILCDDNFLYQMNIDYLQHDTLTDVITFPVSKHKNVVSGEIYISIERVLENSTYEKSTFLNELARVMVHGLLHLLGYNDYTVEEKNLMRQKEDYYLSLLPQKNS